VRDTGRLIIVEEDNLTGGWGAEVAARVADTCVGYLDAPIRRIAAPDTPVPFAPVMENYYVPSVERIVSAAKDLVLPH
jgi:pyruvate dehydrogenase E1 component beta subunit